MTATPQLPEPGPPGPYRDAWRALIESEIRSHEAVANLTPFEGGTFASVRTPEGVLDAAVIRVRPAAIRCELNRWVQDLSHGLRGLGAPSGRVILETPSYHLETALGQLGFTPRSITVMVGPTRAETPGADAAGLSEFVGHRFVLDTVSDDAGWRAVERLHALSVGALEAHRLVALDRLRHESGHLHPYLLWHEGHLCASFTAACSSGLLRLGGWAVDSDREEPALPLATARAALSLGAEAGWTHAGSLVPAGDPWEHTLRLAGFRPIGELVEWAERADPARPAT